MSRSRLVHINSLEELRRRAAPWDDLWQRSGPTIPTLRCELLAQWIERFRPRSRLRILAVEEQGQFIAALPLVGCRVCRVVPAGGLPSNEWTHAGDVMRDPSADSRATWNTLVRAFRELPWKLLSLDPVVLDSTRWRGMVDAVRQAGGSLACEPRFSVGLVDTDGPWQAYQSALSRGHGKKMRRQLGRLEGRGSCRLEVHSRLDPDAVEPLLRCCFEIENRGWKGRGGTSVLQSEGILPYYLRQARQLAEWGQLELALLYCEDRPIAFEYGYAAKGVYHSYKVGYDEAYARYSPGQLLFWKMLERFHGQPDRRLVDCMGPLNDATSKWITRTQRIGRLVVAPGALTGRALLLALRARRSGLRTFRPVQED